MRIVPRQVKIMFHDYSDTWAGERSAAIVSSRARAAVRLYLWPTVPALVFLFVHVRLTTVTPFLTSMSVFTALLFGLLTLIFNTAITLRKDGATLGNAHGLRQVVADLRAIVTYTIFVAFALVITLALGSAFMVPQQVAKPSSSTAGTPPVPPDVVAWGWTPAYVWLAIHLLLNLGDILVRFRTAYNYLSR